MIGRSKMIQIFCRGLELTYAAPVSYIASNALDRFSP